MLPRAQLFVYPIRLLFLLVGRRHLRDLQLLSPLSLTLVADLREIDVACRIEQEFVDILECAAAQGEKLLFSIS